MRRAPAPFFIAALALPACGAPPSHAPHDGHAAEDAGEHADAGHVEGPDLAESEGDMARPGGPSRLSDTGLYADLAAKTLAPGVIRYDVRFQLWSDGAEKDRFLLLPPGAKVDTSDMDNWRFPVGTKVWKEFRREGRRLETRLLQKVEDQREGWFEASYVWNEGETEADVAPAGRKVVRGFDHLVPSQDDCDKCHGGMIDVLIGVSAIQLSAPAGPVPPESPLSRLARAGLLTNPPAADFEPPGQGNDKAALGYMHANCGFCHSAVAPLAIRVPLRLQLLVGDATLDGTGAYATAIGTKARHTLPGGITINVVPGAPEKSQLWVRTGLRDDFAMPPVGSLRPDPTGLQIVSDWIKSLPPK